LVNVNLFGNKARICYDRLRQKAKFIKKENKE